MKRSVLYLLAGAVASLPLWYAANSYRTSAAGALPPLFQQAGLAPATATMLAYTDLTALRQSPWLKQMESFAQAKPLDADYAAFVDATGFDYERDLDRVLIAVGPTSDNAIIVAEGRFDQRKIGQYALRTGTMHQQSGHADYVVPPSSAQGKEVQFTFLGPNRIMLAVGGGGLPDAALALPGTLSLYDAPMLERLSRVAGAPLFAVIKTPPPASAPPSNADPRAGILGQLQTLRWIALAVQPDGANALLSIEGECGSPEDAQRAASTIELMRTLFRGALADSKSRGNKIADQSAASWGKMLDAAKVSTETTRVRLLVTLTPDMFPATPVAPVAPATH